MSGEVSRKMVRRWATPSIDALLNSAGPRAMNRYIRAVHAVSSMPFASSRLGSRLLNLPSPREFEVSISQGTAHFVYATGVGDDLNYSARNHLRGWEVKSRELFLALAAKAEQVVDVGAYTGVYTVLAFLGNSNSQIAAFEPNPALLELLGRNVSGNCPGKRVSVHQVALVEEAASVQLFVAAKGGQSSTASLVPKGSSSQVEHCVQGVRLDDALPGWQPTLMKVDVEGSECGVLRGAPRILTTSRPTILMEALNSTELDRQAHVLSEFGYLPPHQVSSSSDSGDDRNFLWVHPTRRMDVDDVLGQLGN